MRTVLHNRPGAPAERGAILIIALVMLLLITMVSIISIRASTMEERMAGNARDRNKALQAAEAVVRTCLLQVTNVPVTYSGTILDPATSGADNWDVASNWETGSANSVAVTMTGAGLASNPRCMVERLGTGSNFRVTGRAVGASDSSVVILQATYSTD
jgi:type IV pilus assembly protein PilX